MQHTLERKEHSMAEIDATGDTKTIWDPDNPDEVEIARDAFNKLKKKNYVIYNVTEDGKPGSVMHTFDPSATRLVARPAIQGG